ncbi:hypothetical protein CEE44_05135 [Candidatus Woesearchaeota archaeon B3_Woes]|nr:MAG: hypothetical protein CEE44_05135 [Candidatus Woesearchaeota archaeon B3_Woes]
MANIRVTKDDIEALEDKAELAYEVLKLAVNDPRPWKYSSAKCLYENDLGNCLSNLVRPTRHVELLNKGGKRSEKIEKFILQYVLMICTSSAKEGGYKIEITENVDDGMGGLKAYIDAEDDLSSGEGEVYRLISHKAFELRDSGKHALILKAIEYVRDK